jgi:hypothetical protein
MNERRIVLGLVACFSGLIVPVCHHIALYAIMPHPPGSNEILDMRLVFESLPWIDWLYLVVMFAVGAILIISGMLRPLDALANPTTTEAAPRGFEVVGVPERGPGN